VAVAVTSVTLVALAGGAYAVLAPDASDDPSNAASTGAADSSGTPSATSAASGSALEDSLVACRDAVAAADAAVGEARTGVGHWATHVQARVDFEAGRIDEATQKQRWAETRVLGPGDQARFAAADAAFQPRAEACAEVNLAAESTALGTSVEACQQRTAALTAAVEAGRAAMTDWSNHLADMKARVDGAIDSSEGGDRWDHAFHMAPGNINAFREAETALSQAPACTLPS